MVRYPTKQSNNNQKQRRNNQTTTSQNSLWEQIPRVLAEHPDGTPSSAALLRKKEAVLLNGTPSAVQLYRLGLAELPGGLHCAAEDLRKVNFNSQFQNSTADTKNHISREYNQTQYINISSNLEAKNMEIQTINDHTTLSKRSR